MADKSQITIRVKETDREKLQVIADKELRSINNLIEYIIRKFLEGSSDSKQKDS